MNKIMKKHLETVVNSIVKEDTKAAKSAFHEYLTLKTQSILLSEKKDEDDMDDDMEDDEDDDMEDKKSKSKKKGKKELPDFIKDKMKKSKKKDDED